MKRRFLARMLSVALALSITLLPSSTHAYEMLPTEFDLSDIFADEAAIEDGFARANALIDEFSKLRGTLKDAESISRFMDLSTQANEVINRLYVYGELLNATDVSNPQALNISSRVQNLYARCDASRMYFDGEICALDIAERTKLLASPELSNYAWQLNYLLEDNYVPLSEDAAAIQATLAEAAETAGIYNSLASLELPYPTFTSDDGSQIELNAAAYSSYMADSAHNREQRIAASNTYYSRYKPFLNTFAAIFNAHAASNWALAKSSGYSSTLEYQLDQNCLPTTLYDETIGAARSMLDDFYRFSDVQAQALDLDTLYAMDIYDSVSSFMPAAKSYERMAGDVRNAIEVLGDEYCAAYDEMLTSGHVDVYYAPGELSNGFTATFYGGTLPYTLLGFSGIGGEDSVLAHEMGHAVYSMLAMRNQPLSGNYMTVLAQEVAASVNEYLYNFYLLDSAQSDDEKLYYLQKMILDFYSNAITQAMYSEFEQYAYTIVESGGALDGDALSAKFGELNSLYRGEKYLSYAGMEDFWAAIPHFEWFAYYVYQYSSAAFYALGIAQRIYSGDEGASAAYINFLKSGSSDEPIALLNMAGVNTDEAFARTRDTFSGWVDSYAELLSIRG